MARSEAAFRRARRAYELAHTGSALRGIALGVGLIVLAIGLHEITRASWTVAALLVASLGALGWRGGALRRGAFAGVVAGLPPLVAPTIVFALSHGGNCASCEMGTSWTCILACFGTSSALGMIVGHRATTDESPRRFAIAAIATAALTGLLGCGTTGLGGALGVVLGLVAGGVTGWVVAGRTAHA